MQLRSLFAALCLFAVAMPAMAQQGNPRTADTAAGKYATPKGSLLAYNTSTTDYPGKLSYAKVPLAGEKAYFGDKNEYLNNFVKAYLEQHSRTLSSVQTACNAPFAVIDNILDGRKMPRELKYLAVIESALNNNARSHAGAVGPWQLMESTAKMLGLNVSRTVDERKDLAKSTDAASRYLDLLYNDLNDWLLVIAAYNSGPVPVHRAIEKTGSHNFWDIKKYLPQETQGHVLAFLATATIFENFGKFISLGSVPADMRLTNDKDDEPADKEPMTKKISTPPAVASVAASAPPVVSTATATPAAAPPAANSLKANFTEEELKNMAIIKIDKPVLFEVMEHELGISKKLMMRWNPDYDQFVANKYATPFYKIKMPKDKVDAFLQKRHAMELQSLNMYR
ncbi:MAG: hypothetical protein EBZ77_15530 [Chitinophagia bacterium]|nr:hypothetical protein [Chitinophagia bacterium]